MKKHSSITNITILSCSFTVFLGLTACSTASETFDSEPGKGVGAKPITQVNKMVDRGEINGITPSKEEREEVYAPVFSPSALQNPNIETIHLSNKTILHRQPERHLRLWVAPFQDAQGNFHEGAVIHTLLARGYWQMSSNPYRA